MKPKQRHIFWENLKRDRRKNKGMFSSIFPTKNYYGHSPTPPKKKGRYKRWLQSRKGRKYNRVDMALVEELTEKILQTLESRIGDTEKLEEAILAIDEVKRVDFLFNR